MSSTMNMMSHLEYFIIREVNKMNIHQFMTVSVFYLRKNVGTSKLVNVLKNAIVKHIEEFDRIQLTLLRAALQANTLEDNAPLIKTLEERIDYINEEETASVDEEQLRMLIRKKLMKIKEDTEKKKETNRKLGIDKRDDRATSDSKYFEVKSSVEEPVKEAAEDEGFIDEKAILKNKLMSKITGNVVEEKKDEPTPKRKEVEAKNEMPNMKKPTLLKDYLKSKAKMKN
jgi:hypothetical protein